MSQAGVLTSGGGVLPDDVPLFFETESGTAIPAGNILQVVGGDGITTEGTSNIVTIGLNPVAKPFFYDDFNGVSSGLDSATVSSAYEWYSTQNYLQPTNLSDSSHPGVISNEPISAGSSQGIWLNRDGVAQLLLGGGEITLIWIFKIITLSTDAKKYILRCGLGDTTTGTNDQANGVYVEYTHTVNSGNWVYKTAAASTRTESNSSTPVTAAWHKLEITINAAASSISFSMDGVSLGSAITTNIPTLAITPFFQIASIIGTVTASSVLIDMFYMAQTLTTPR